MATNKDKPPKTVDEYRVAVPRLAVVVEGNELDRHPIARAITTLTHSVNDTAWAFAVSVPNAQKTQVRFLRRLATTQRQHLAALKKTVGTEQAEAAAAVLDTSQKIENLLRSRMPSTIVSGLFIQLFCEFDNYVGDLIRGISELDESLFYGLKREITIGELKSLPTIDALRNDLLEKEIESLRRESYSKQFQSLEKDYEVSLTKFPEWSQFIEASQRRNLFTHAGGVVSDQYLSVCTANGHSRHSLPEKGALLKIEPEYFFETCKIVELTGVMLGQTLWRKIFPQKIELADRHLNELIYENLLAGDFLGTIRLCDFGLQPQLTKHSTGVSRRIRVINKAIALSRIGKNEEAKSTLASEDWTDTLRDFSLARAVIEERFAEAADLMRKIGKEGELVMEPAYRNWPLFWNFRTRPEFLSAYEDVFGYSFSSNVASEVGAIGDAVPEPKANASRRPRKSTVKAAPRRGKATKD